MAKQRKSTKPLTDYGLKRKFNMVDGSDIPALAIAVNDQGFYFEQEITQDLVNKTHKITFMFPDGPSVVVEGKKEDDLAYQLARKLMEEEIL